MAVPLHGDHRARNVLRRAALGLALGCAALASAGCDDGTDPEGAGGDVAADAPGAATGDGAADAVLERLAASLGDAPAGQVPAPRWPEDLGAHPNAPFEAREWLSVLRDAEGEVWGLHQRIVRVAPPGAGADGGAAGGGATDGRARSPWRYGAVVRVDGTLERAGGERRRWSATEREAVGLAGLATGPSFSLGVLGHEVASAGALPDDGCGVDWRVVAPGAARLDGVQDHCPEGGAAAGAAFAIAGPVATSGTLVAEVEGQGRGAELAPDRAVRGVSWLRSSWGAPALPGAGAAVSFDRAALALEGLGAVELVRSRRTGGRGRPRTTLVALDPRAREAGVVAGLETSWTLPGDAPGTDVRDAGRLRVPALGVDVALRALSPVVAERDALESVFRGAVVASGTHRGAGFVEHRPIASDRPAADDAQPPTS